MRNMTGSAPRGSMSDAERSMGRWRRLWQRRRWLGAVLGIALLGSGCEGLLDSDKLPEHVSDPRITETPEGARFAYTGTLAQFRAAFGQENAFVEATGLFTDELQVNALQQINLAQGRNLLDRRVAPEGPSSLDTTSIAAVYGMLQRVRGQAGQAIGLLSRYVPEEPALAGHLFALQGYAEVLLAESYCSGIPLSTVDFSGDFTYRAGSTAEAVLGHASALFDTAFALLAGDAARTDLARVGQARALLGLGQYAAAAAVVAPVPDGYRYDVTYTADSVAGLRGGYIRATSFAYVKDDEVAAWEVRMSDGEGGNGLDWRTSGDPRTRFTTAPTVGNPAVPFIYHPDKYPTDGSGPIVLASGVEARLIEAEAALQAGDAATWLAKLNALRTDGTFDTTETSPPDTLWHAGTGGVAGLAPLGDPGPDGRVDLLFRERGFWMYLTGHRQGDLRRLVRQYGRDSETVYPTGSFQIFPTLFYGADVTWPITTRESANPLFTGCITRSA